MKGVPYRDIESLPYLPPTLGVRELEKIGVLQKDPRRSTHGHFDPDSFVQDPLSGIMYPTAWVKGLVSTAPDEELYTANDAPSVIGARNLDFLGSREDIDAILAASSTNSTQTITRQALQIALALGRTKDSTVVAQTVAQIFERCMDLNMHTETETMQTLEEGTFAFRALQNIKGGNPAKSLTTADIATATASGWNPMGRNHSGIRKMFNYLRGIARLSYAQVANLAPIHGSQEETLTDPLHKLAHDATEPHSFWDDVVRVLALLRPRIFERIGDRVEELSQKTLDGIPDGELSVFQLGTANENDLN